MRQGLCRKGWTACKNTQGLKAETGRLEELAWSPCPSPRADKALVTQFLWIHAFLEKEQNAPAFQNGYMPPECAGNR